MKEIQQICLDVQVLKPNNSIDDVVLDLNLFESELQQSLLYCKHIKESFSDEGILCAVHCGTYKGNLV